MMSSAVQKVSPIDVQPSATDPHLIIEVSQKKLWYSLPPHVIRQLTDLARNL